MKKLLLAVAVVYVALQAAVLAILSHVGLARVAALQLAVDESRARELTRRLLTADPLTVQWYARHLVLDDALAVVYGVGLVLALWAAGARGDRTWWLVVPGLAGLLDLVENACQRQLLAQAPEVDQVLVVYSMVASLAKWAMVLATFLLLALAALLRRRRPAQPYPPVQRADFVARW